MRINKIKVSNFKSFKELDLELGNFNVVIGANASGKSNFVEIFKFLRDIEQSDLRNAISMHGGIASLSNIKTSGESILVHFLLDNKIGFEDKESFYEILQMSATFSFRPDSSSKGFAVHENEYSQIFDLIHKHKEKPLREDLQTDNTGTLTIKLENSKPVFDITPPEMEEQLKEAAFMPPLEIVSQIFKKEDFLFFQRPFPFVPGIIGFDRMGIYDIDPHSAKNPVKITGKAELEEDGKNLALILNHILEDKEKKRKLGNLLNSLLPFVVTVGTEKFAEKSLLITLQEKYYDRQLRADLLSDGTVNIAALLVTLYFEDKDVIFLEEPERNLHPHLISGIVQMMKEVSEKKQLFITTHSPELIKHAGIENLLLISRNEEGNSVVTRPQDSGRLKIFLKNELGLDDLFVQNLLDLQ